jgi:hypothetical protein
MCVNGGRRVACTRLRFHSLFMRVWVMGLFSWSRPEVGRVSGGRLSLGWCSCTARAVHAPMPASFSDNACLTFSVCLLWCFLCFFSSSLSMGFRYYWSVFRACFARINLLIFRNCVEMYRMTQMSELIIFVL